MHQSATLPSGRLQHPATNPGGQPQNRDPSRRLSEPVVDPKSQAGNSSGGSLRLPINQKPQSRKEPSTQENVDDPTPREEQSAGAIAEDPDHWSVMCDEVDVSESTPLTSEPPSLDRVLHHRGPLDLKDLQQIRKQSVLIHDKPHVSHTVQRKPRRRVQHTPGGDTNDGGLMSGIMSRVKSFPGHPGLTHKPDT